MVREMNRGETLPSIYFSLYFFRLFVLSVGLKHSLLADPCFPPSSSSVCVLCAQSKHHPDLIMCRKMPGIAIGRLCEKCE
jgi:hypothetical protein